MAKKTPAQDAYAFINARLHQNASKQFDFLRRQGLRDPTDTGFYIGVYDITNPQAPILVGMCLIGEIPDAAKCEKYQRFVRRKCVDQLAANPDHISSFQSRDLNSERYAGAIRSSKNLWSGLVFAIGTSGLDELDDEIISTQVAIDLRLLTQIDDAFVIANVSNNENLLWVITAS